MSEQPIQPDWDAATKVNVGNWRSEETMRDAILAACKPLYGEIERLTNENAIMDDTINMAIATANLRDRNDRERDQEASDYRAVIPEPDYESSWSKWREDPHSGAITLQWRQAVNAACKPVVDHAVKLAAEVERLKEALTEIISDDPKRSWGTARKIARDALAQINNLEEK